MSFLIEPAPAANDNEPPSLLDAPSAPSAPTALSSFSKTEALGGEGPFPQSIIRMTGRLMDAMSAARVPSLFWPSVPPCLSSWPYLPIFNRAP